MPAEKKATPKPEIARKIAPKLCVRAGPPIDNKPNHIGYMRVFGIANRCEIIQTDKGESVKFRGDFIASDINGEPGQIRAATCFLPRSAAEMLETAIERATHDATNQETGAVGQVAVQFGFRLFQKNDASAATGYVWGVESLIDFASADTDPLLQLVGSVT